MNPLLNNGKKPGPLLSYLIKASAEQTDDCVIWPFATNRKTGYGMVQYGQTGRLAHRVACIYVHGEPPCESMQAAHSCRNRACINGRHLRWATCKENIADKAKDGTKGIGETHPYAKLTQAQVDEIRQRAKNGESQRTLGRAFGVHRTNIHRIVTGDTWRGQ